MSTQALLEDGESLSSQALLASLEIELRVADPLTATRLASLQAALGPGSDPGGWIGVSLFEVVDVDAVASRVTGSGHADHGAARDERLRNVLILFPIVLTWASLAYAAYGYQVAVAADPTLVEQPFLLLWEQGFRGLVPWPISLLSFLSLWFVALVDVVLVGIVIYLTIRIQTRVSVDQAHRDEQARALAGRLHDALGGASLELAARATAPALIATLKTTAQGLTAELKAERLRLAGLGDENERYVAELRTIAADLRNGSEGFVDGVRSLAPALDRLDAANTAISAGVLAIAATQERLAGALADQTAELRHEHARLGDLSADMRSLAETAVGTAEATWPAASARLERAQQEFRGEVDRLRQAIEGDRTDRRNVEQSMAASVGEIGRLASATAGVVEGQHEVLSRVATALTSLEKVSDDLGAMVRRQGEFAERAERSMVATASALDSLSRRQGDRG